MIIISANAIDILEAFHILFELQAAVVASGGINGAEGAKTFVIQGDERQVVERFTL